MSETIITVEGRFDCHHPAERGTVRLTAVFHGVDRAEIVGRTTHLQSSIAADAKKLHDPTKGPVTWWSADRLRVWSHRPGNKDGKLVPLIHHAAVTMELKFRDFTRLGDWAERLATVDGVSIDGISWALTEVTKARLTLESRHRAVLDATEKAGAYARSLGLSAVHPLALADPGMLGDHSSPSTWNSATVMQRAMKDDNTAKGLDLKPEDITIAARVHARFTAF